MAVNRVILQHFSMRYDYMTPLERPNIYEPSTEGHLENYEDVPMKSQATSDAILEQKTKICGQKLSFDDNHHQQQQYGIEVLNESEESGSPTLSDGGDKMRDMTYSSYKNMEQKEDHETMGAVSQISPGNENSSLYLNTTPTIPTSKPVSPRPPIHESQPEEKRRGLDSIVEIKDKLPSNNEYPLNGMGWRQRPAPVSVKSQSTNDSNYNYRVTNQWDQIPPEENWRYRSNSVDDHYSSSSYNKNRRGYNNTISGSPGSGGNKRNYPQLQQQQQQPHHQQYNNRYNNYYNNRNYFNKYGSSNKDTWNYDQPTVVVAASEDNSAPLWRRQQQQQQYPSYNSTNNAYDYGVRSNNMQIYSSGNCGRANNGWPAARQMMIRSGGGNGSAESNVSSSASSSPNETDCYVGLSPPTESLLMQRRLRDRHSASAAGQGAAGGIPIVSQSG